jgi:hypothetical protein
MSADTSLDLGNEQYTLGQLAFRLEPEIYRDWKATVEARRKEAVFGSSFPSWERSQAAAYLADLQHGTCHSQFTKDERQFNELLTRLHSAVRQVIASTDYCTQGIGPAGTMIDVPHGMAHQLKIDLEANTVSTQDGGMIWRGVMVRAATDQAPALERRGQERRTLGRPRKWDWDGALFFLVARANTPDGLPPVQADVEKMIADYFGRKNGGDCPSESSIREKVQLLFDAMDQEKRRR